MPQVFFTPSHDVAKEIQAFAKHAYDRTSKYQSNSGGAQPLDELYVDGFDADQVWEQLRLLNGPLLAEMTQRIRSFRKAPGKIKLFVSEEQEESREEEEQEAESDAENEEETLSSEEKSSDDEEVADASLDTDDNEVKKAKKKSKKTRDVAEDGFFDWDEMDKAAEEQEDEDDDDEDEDMDGDGGGADGESVEDDDNDSEMEEGSDAEAAEEMKYGDFFGNEDDAEDGEDGDEEGELNDNEKPADDNDEDEYPIVKHAKPGSEEIVDDEELAERGIMSSHQRQRLRHQKEIKELEHEAIGEKPWLLKGEVRSAA